MYNQSINRSIFMNMSPNEGVVPIHTIHSTVPPKVAVTNCYTYIVHVLYKLIRIYSMYMLRIQSGGLLLL